MAGRRKQQAPQANRGPVEARQPQEEPNEQLAADLDLDAWEEEHAIEVRPRKRARKGVTVPMAERPILADAVQPSWAFAHLCFFHTLDESELAADAPETQLNNFFGAVSGASVTFTPTDQPGCHLQATAPSEEAADAFIHLLRNNYLVLGPFSSAPPSSQPYVQCEASSSQSSSFWTTVGLAERALADNAAYPDDKKRRLMNAQLLAVLRWLLPDAGLDPDAEDLPLDAPEDIANSPLCSPKKAGNEGHAAHLPGSPTARNTDAGHAVTFDAAELYRAVKPSGQEAQLQRALPHLKPTLRSYQRRAAQWMLDREQSGAKTETGSESSLHPLWRRVPLVGRGQGPRGRGKRDCGATDDDNKCFFVNPYSGLLSLDEYPVPPPPKGGILADEMGLGKTVELLALVTANPYTGPPPDFSTKQDAKPQHERVDCPCGAYSDRPEEEEGSYDGLWLQCETCLAWQHGACVGHPRRAPQGDYICGPCLRAQAQTEVSQPCGTTLIVCPAPILQQWWEEIHRHIHPGALQVVIYEGQPQPTSGHKRPKIVTAADLAVADIALTTYDVLRKDLNHEPNEPGFYSDRIMRRQKKYQVIPTPLTRLRFWRVAIDEAQMVESSTAKAAAMALLLETEHRWCVTGTPLSRGLEDLQGLMAFLKVDPYSERHWWQRCIQRPYEAGSRAARARLLTLLKPSAGGLLWRSAKADVKEELGLPPQHSHLTHLTFSAIERHFYSRQHQDCVGTARAAISASTLAAAQAAASEVLDLNSSSPRHASAFEDRPLTQREEQKVLHPLVKLRQACVHPQVGAGGIRSLSQSRAPMTMREVLDVLLSKARVEAEDAQRVLLASLNGLAGLLLLQGHVAEAVRAYREVLGMVEANAALVRADKLQQLHTLHNLGLVLEGPAKGLPDVPRTLRDSTLAERAAVLREEYLAEPVAKLAAAEAELREAQAGGDKIRSDLHRELGRDSETLLSNWYVDAIHLLTTHTHDEGSTVTQQIKDQLSESDTYRYFAARNASNIADRFRNLFGLQMVLKQDLKDMHEAQEAAMKPLTELQASVADPSPSLVELAANCASCRGMQGRLCAHCKLDEKFTGWEVRLFSLKTTGMEAGKRVTAEEAARAAHQQTMLRRAGRGGLNEQAGPGQAPIPGARRTAAVAESTVVRHPSQVEQVLRMLMHQLRGVRVPPAVAAQRDVLLTAAKAHLELFEVFKREFLKGRALALEQRQKLYALDELEMCTMRIRLRAPGESVTALEELFKVLEPEIPVRSTELSADKAVAAADLKRTLGTLRYLQSLKAEQERKAAAALSPQKVGHAAADGVAGDGPAEEAMADVVGADACPVCHEPFGTELVMLSCGHRLCCKCQLAMVEQLPASQPAATKRIGCPTCRSRVPLSEIAYIVAPEPGEGEDVDLTKETDGASPSGRGEAAWARDGGVKVQGSYGTKLEAVVRRLVSITRSDSGARVLVFSSWKDSLELLAHALTANGLPHIFPRSSKHFEAAVAQFRAGHEAFMAAANGASSSTAPTPAVHRDAPRVLLLLLKQGGNGLNLQQAQHVVFIEPVLDPAEEAQAMGRVDRIGQTHATHVHRFVVTHSVEENVHKLGQYRAAAMDMSAAAVRRGKAGGDRGALTVRDVAALLAEDGNHHRHVE